MSIDKRMESAVRVRLQDGIRVDVLAALGMDAAYIAKAAADYEYTGCDIRETGDWPRRYIVYMADGDVTCLVDVEMKSVIIAPTRTEVDA